MTSMIERMAEAQYAVLREQAAGRLPAWAELDLDARALMLKQVRAGIEGLRGPSETVAKAGGDWWYATLHNNKGQQENGTIIWLSMIDAMLKEQL